MRKRNKKIAFWVTESEQKRIKKLADRTGMKDGEYLLSAALGKTIYQVEELKPMLHELKGIGRNLNQMTRLAHIGVVKVINCTEACKALGRVYTVINGLYDSADGVIAGGKVGDPDRHV